MPHRIAWSEPAFDDSELAGVIDSFEADWLTMGPKVKKFEAVLAAYHGIRHAMAVSNGSVAIDLVLKALGVGPGDEVIVPAMTYFATASMVSYQHATPVFVDVENDSYNLDPARIEAAITQKTRAIIFIDYGGNPADIDGLKAVAEAHAIPLVHDAAQSLGAIYKGQPVGNQCQVATMSFHMAKIMTSVEGGMVLTRDAGIAEEIRIRRNQGESGKYLHSHLGTNARMTDITAAIGLAQFAKLDKLLAARRHVAEKFNTLFDGHNSIEVAKCTRLESRHAYFFYPILVDNRDHVVERLAAAGIDTRIAYSMPVYAQELYACGRATSRAMPCPVSERFTQRVINLPIYPDLHDDAVGEIAETVIAAL